ncbi:hypothetical protein V2J09_003582 [Rumex salicifolius]
MINGHDFYNVMSAMVPLYVAMIVAYAAVRWWKILTAEQCSGISRFVASFAVPLLSFHFISANNPYKMNLLFVAADTLQKLIIIALLGAWAAVFRSRGDIAGASPLEWAITAFSLATLPNTLVMGIPLLVAMYGESSGAGGLMVQVVVPQCIVWYTLLLCLFEFRGAKTLISRNFPDTAVSIAAITVESDVASLDGHQDPLETESHVGTDGRLHVTIRRSMSSALAGAEIFSVSSGGTPSRVFGAVELYSDHSSVGPMTPRPSMKRMGTDSGRYGYSEFGRRSLKKSRSGYSQLGREMHMFRWSTRESPATEISVFGGGRLAAVERFSHSVVDGAKEVRLTTTHRSGAKEDDRRENAGGVVRGGGGGEEGGGGGEEAAAAGKQMPAASVMTKLILVMVWRKLIRNPNMYASIIGLVWSLISYRWNVEMPKIIANSISILSNTGLGMAMFSLGLFMALQPKLIACGNRLALFSMVLRFIVGPAVAALSSVALGIRGNLLKISIVQAALPLGIVPFVFAKEYNNHPTVLSTGVIFGMLVALPIDLLYYILLEL